MQEYHSRGIDRLPASVPLKDQFRQCRVKLRLASRRDARTVDENLPQMLQAGKMIEHRVRQPGPRDDELAKSRQTLQVPEIRVVKVTLASATPPAGAGSSTLPDPVREPPYSPATIPASQSCRGGVSGRHP